MPNAVGAGSIVSPISSSDSGVEMDSPIARVLGLLATARKNGSGWSARCPAHDDRVASLSVSEGDDGRVLVHCHAGCESDAVLGALGLTAADLFAPKQSTSRPRDHIVATYGYHDEERHLLFEKLRYEPKRFVQRRPDGVGFHYNLDGARRVPFRLPQLVEAIGAGRRIFIVEGEKAAEALVDVGFVATCGNGGAGKWHHTEREHFRGARVVVLADNDDPGRKHALDVARSLDGLAESVQLVELPGLPPKGDVFDFFALEHTAEELKELVRAAPLFAATEIVDRQPVGDESGGGHVLLDDVAAFIGRYVACSPAGRDAGALWIVHTHAFEAAEASPRFALLSAEPQSGKTRYLEVLKLLVRAPLFAVNISEAALFRVIEARRPTVLHDEIDAVFGPKARDREDLRAMLNSGYERGATVERCVGEGSKLAVKSFAVFAPVAMAGIGKLPETIALRTITERMKRRAPDEPVEKLRRRQVAPEADRLRGRLETWAAANLAALSDAEPDMPDELDDRAADIWEPLVAIADQAGGDWPARARAAALALFGARRDDEATIGVRLLADCQAVFGDDAGLASGDLAARIGAIEGAPWAEWSGEHRDKPISAHGLAKLLGRYDIKPRQHRVGTESFRGYLRSDFADVWQRYIPSRDECNNDASATTQAQQGQGLLHSDTCCTSPGEEEGRDSTDPLDADPEPCVGSAVAEHGVPRCPACGGELQHAEQSQCPWVACRAVLCVDLPEEWADSDLLVVKQ